MFRKNPDGSILVGMLPEEKPEDPVVKEEEPTPEKPKAKRKKKTE